MLTRIKSRINAALTLLGSFVLVSCHTSSDDIPTEYGILPYIYSNSCDANQEMSFYSELCYSSIGIYADLHNYEKYKPANDDIRRLNKEFKNAVSIADNKCCSSLKPKEMELDAHYCDRKPVIDEQYNLGCETYIACIRDVILHKDGINHPLCKSDDDKNKSASDKDSKQEQPQ